MQNIALESFDGECQYSECDEVSNMIADIQNEEDSSDSNDNYEEEEVTTNTDDDTRAPDGSDDDRQTILGKDEFQWFAQLSPKSVKEDYKSRLLLKLEQHVQHFLHLASCVTVLFLDSASYLTSLC